MYKKRLSMKRKTIVSIICMLIFSFISSNTYAEEKIGSIKVDTTMYKINDYNFSFALYYIGELKNNRVLLRDELSDLNIDINLNTMTSSEVSDVSKIVDKRIKELDLPYDKRNTGSDKMATFDSLNEGVYLITQSSQTGKKSKKYDVDPFIVSVPYCFRGEEILNVVAKPKIEPTDPIKPTDPTEPENPDKPQDNDDDKPNKDEEQNEDERNPSSTEEDGSNDKDKNNNGKTDLTIGKPKTGDNGLLRPLGIFLIALALFIYIRKR